jgi:glucuronate isomerase
MIRDSGWHGRVIPAYRPDAVVDPETPGFAANIERLGEMTGEDATTWVPDTSPPTARVGRSSRA